MRYSRLATLLLAMVLTLPSWAQQAGKDVVVDYNNPKKYIVGGVKVEGNSYFSPEQILQITGLQKDMEVTVPSEEMSSIVSRLWLQRYFEDVAIAIDSIAPSRDTAFFKVSIIERPTSAPRVKMIFQIINSVFCILNYLFSLIKFVC